MKKQFVDRLVKAHQILYLSGQDVLNLDIYNFRLASSLVTEVFKQHYRNQTIMPRSEYLTYPHRSAYDRVICLIGHIGGEHQISGVKVINSSTTNHQFNLPRASGVLLLCDVDTQRIYSIIEASHVSAVRTAAVAATAIQHIKPNGVSSIAILGCGILALTHLRMVAQLFAHFNLNISVYDLNSERAVALASAGKELGLNVAVSDSGEDAIRKAYLVIPATTALHPWIQKDWLPR